MTTEISRLHDTIQAKSLFNNIEICDVRECDLTQNSIKHIILIPYRDFHYKKESQPGQRSYPSLDFPNRTCLTLFLIHVYVIKRAPKASYLASGSSSRDCLGKVRALSQQIAIAYLPFRNSLLSCDLLIGWLQQAKILAGILSLNGEALLHYSQSTFDILYRRASLRECKLGSDLLFHRGGLIVLLKTSISMRI